MHQPPESRIMVASCDTLNIVPSHIVIIVITLTQEEGEGERSPDDRAVFVRRHSMPMTDEYDSMEEDSILSTMAKV